MGVPPWPWFGYHGLSDDDVFGAARMPVVSQWQSVRSRKSAAAQIHLVLPGVHEVRLDEESIQGVQTLVPGSPKPPPGHRQAGNPAQPSDPNLARRGPASLGIWDTSMMWGRWTPVGPRQSSPGCPSDARMAGDAARSQLQTSMTLPSRPPTISPSKQEMGTDARGQENTAKPAARKSGSNAEQAPPREPKEAAIPYRVWSLAERHVL